MRRLIVVNNRNEIIGSASQKDVYSKKLSHRIVHVLVFNQAEMLCLQLRSKTKKYLPEHWVTSASGHVNEGEEYEEAAKRELKEELGIGGELEFLFENYYIGEQEVGKFFRVYKTVCNENFNITEEDVDRAEFFSFEKIKEMIKNGEKFHPELLFILEKQFNIK